MCASVGFSLRTDGHLPLYIENGVVQYHEGDNNTRLNELIPALLDLPSAEQLISFPVNNRHTLQDYYPDIPRLRSRYFRLMEALTNDEYSQALEIVLDYFGNDSLTSRAIRACGNGFLAFSKLFYPFGPGQAPPTIEEELNEYIKTRDWRTQSIRHAQWHPTFMQFAIVKNNDNVDVYAVNRSEIVTLEYRMQYGVTCVSFRPSNIRDIAIGCMDGIYIWDIDTKSITHALRLKRSPLLYRKNRKYVTDIAWSNRGDLLAVTLMNNRKVHVWDMSRPNANAFLREYGDGNPTLISWSPSSTFLFANTATKEIRFWMLNKRWASETWNIPAGRVTIACWSPCSSFLLYVSSAAPSCVNLLKINFNGSHSSSDEKISSYSLVDLSKRIPYERNYACGDILNMVWDKKGLYLAVIFKRSSLVAIFGTRVEGTVNLVPKCLIRGRIGELPLVISFQRDFEDGANLLIIWSSGRIQYFPAIETPAQRSRERPYQRAAPDGHLSD